MVYAAICDDITTEAQFTARRVSELLGNDRVETECFSSAEELLSVIERCDYRPDIAVLDIQLDSGMDGIALAKWLNELVPECAVIFLTGFEEYCSDVYSTEHVFFIGKTRVDQYLPTALEKAVENVENREENPSLLRFSVGRTTYCVSADDVMYLERKLRKTVIVTQDRQYTVSTSPTSLQQQLDGGKIVQCHQSYWVNCRYISGMNAHEILLRNGHHIPVSRSKAQSTKNAYFSYIGKTFEHSGNYLRETTDEL